MQLRKHTDHRTNVAEKRETNICSSNLQAETKFSQTHTRMLGRTLQPRPKPTAAHVH